MFINKGHKIRVYPAEEQINSLTKHFGANRWLYNYYLEHKGTRKLSNKYKLAKNLTSIKKLEQYNWLNDISRQSQINVLRSLDQAFQNFYKGITKYPKYKSKHNSKQSFKVNYPYFRIEDTGIWVIKIGLLKCKYKLPNNHKLISATISKTNTNKYYISINLETNIPDPIIDPKKPEIGIDFGIKNFITTSNGDIVTHPQPHKKYHKKINRLQRALSRKTNKSSNRRFKNKYKLAKVYERCSDIRLDFLHKLSCKLIVENQAIYLEDLNLEGMKKRYGKSINDLGWSEFTRQLEYKGKWYGRNIVKIDRYYPSSKRCSSCNYFNNFLKLSDREWVCPNCLTSHDRDVNASKNIYMYGRVDRNLRTGRDGLVKTLVEPSNSVRVGQIIWRP